MTAAGDAHGTQLVGTTIADRYELCAPLAHGGMGIVFRGWDHWLCRPVAIKAVPLYTASNQYPKQVRGQWQWEARVMAAVQHPNVVRIHDALTDRDRGYLIMELVEGTDLKHYVAQAGPLPCLEALYIGIQVCQALHALHARGLIHRDVKPHNILRTSTGWVKLTDFGLVQCVYPRRQLEDASSNSTWARDITPRGTLTGTATYCSPEQARSEPLTAATDVYSLGVVLYELLAGVPPFVGATPLSLATQHTSVPVPALRRIRPDIPPVVEQVILQTLAKSPSRRFASARALGVALDYAHLAVAGAVERGASPSWLPAAVAQRAPAPQAQLTYRPAAACGTVARRQIGVHGASSAQQNAMQLNRCVRRPRRRDETRARQMHAAMFEYPTAPLAQCAARQYPTGSMPAGKQGRSGGRNGDTEAPPPATHAGPARSGIVPRRRLDPIMLLLCIADTLALFLLIILLSWAH